MCGRARWWIGAGLGLLSSASALATGRPTAALEAREPTSIARFEVPKTPTGLERCRTPIAPPSDLPRTVGESVRYIVDVDGLSVGTIDFQITRDGAFGGEPVTEYRSVFKLDALVATLVPADGRAAALVPLRTSAPLRAMNHYTSGPAKLSEEVTYTENGRQLRSVRTKNGARTDEARRFAGPAWDFVSGFYFLRALPRAVQGCTVIYGNQRAYTVWIEPRGEASIKTPVGYQMTDHYAVRYASERSKAPRRAALWLAQSADRLPYRVRIDGPHPLEARIHLYEKGRP